MIEARQRLIFNQPDGQLKRAVDRAVDKFGEDFWDLLYGVDAYVELRKRRLERKKLRTQRRLEDFVAEHAESQ